MERTEEGLEKKIFADIEAGLEKLAAKGQFRSLTALPACGGKFFRDGKVFLNFSSNDYLDLAGDPRVKGAALAAVEQWGCGSAGSRLMCGHLALHEALEKILAELLDTESALVFGSGFLTNLGAISALAGPGDMVLFDRLDHASLIDGIRLSGARWQRFRHNDTQELRRLLEAHGKGEGRLFIVVDSVFSMDGDIAPLAEIHSLADAFGAFLMVDEAHAIGVFGPCGGGICRDLGIRADLITGTFSKSLGGYGGFAACSARVREWLINRARPFIFSTALPPASAAAAHKAVEILFAQPDQGKTLLDNSRFFHGLLAQKEMKLLPFASQIVPILVGENERAVALAAELENAGLYVKAIRPPTVPPGTARLRLSVTLAHDRGDLAQTAERIVSEARRLGVL
ncbi:MAG: 8-amino-7-oxononanoate synthase [Deltaproteobacteria bacterium]|nr:8-amino-7-oxononanoate synthase [Deltaproteobacteria bacterium]